MTVDWVMQSEVTHRGQVCRAILQALPDWFGRPDAIDDYVTTAERQPMFVALKHDKPVGFVSISQHFARSFEIHSMGVLQPFHRTGIGCALVAQATAFVAAQSGDFLTVKTVSDAWEDENYARTRAFYLGIGFTPIEEFETLWGDVPCLMLIKAVKV